MAVGAEGVHIGQDDMEVKQARKMLGPDAVIGATVSSIEEANIAIQAGADYLGIGTMFATPTKTDTKSIIGTKGTQEILAACGTGSKKAVPCVAIGSLNALNVQRVLHQSASGENYLSGVAIVSAIMASTVPSEAASQLLKLISSARDTFYAATAPGQEGLREMRKIVPQISSMIAAHAKSSILCHNMTNTVVQNFAANVCLATGSSPIMSLNGPEAADLAKLGGALVVNMGTVTPEILDVYLAGMRAYNASGNPILFDPGRWWRDECS